MANRVYGYQGYKGYQYETSPKKLQPEYEPNEQKEKKVEKKQVKRSVNSKKDVVKKEQQKEKISKEELKRKATFVSYIVFGFAVLFTISYRNSIINEKFNEKQELKSQLSEIQKVNEQLEVSVEKELNLTSIEKIAKESLGMSKLNNNQKVYVNLPKKEYVESKTERITTKQTESIYQKIYNKVKSFID